MSDFSDGASVGFGIQQRILAKKLKEQETKRYNDETAYSRQRDQVLDERWGKEFGSSEEMRKFSRTDADRRHALSAEELAERKRVNQEQERKERLKYVMRNMGGEGMQTIAAGLQLGDDRRLRAAQIAKMEAETQAIKAKNLGAPAPAPADASQEPLTPEAQEIANSISALQTKIGQNKVQMAQGDNRTGFLNLFSRQGQIDDDNAKLANLLKLQQTGGTAQPGAQPNPDAARMLQWAQANPNDPRAAAILQKAGK